jgi:hypothetical protein
VKAIVDTMKERNIPAFRRRRLRLHFARDHVPHLPQLAGVAQPVHRDRHQQIFNGEIGRYEGTRFIEQNQIPKGGAADSTTFDPWTNTTDGWNNGQVLVGVLLRPRHRDGGDRACRRKSAPRSRRTSGARARWLGTRSLGFGIVHDVAADSSRIVMWDSAA